jgi:glycosyltransferase involved in cell wall biosynthesis
MPRVVHVHIEEDEAGLRWALKSPPELIVTCARSLIDHVRRSLPERMQETARVVAVPNAVDIEKFTPSPKREAKRKVGAPEDGPLALMLANLSPHKGQATLIRAAAMLKSRGVKLTCWLAGIERGGEGEYTESLRGLIREAGVEDRVVLLGQRRDAADLLRAADLFFLPSTHEGLPLCVLEAQATKVPVLAAPTAGVPEVITDGETGRLIDAANAEEYAYRAEELLTTPALYRSIAEKAFDQVTREHSWSTYCERITALYEELRELRPAPATQFNESAVD